MVARGAKPKTRKAEARKALYGILAEKTVGVTWETMYPLKTPS